MPDKFDPYREALVLETQTVWPAEAADLSEADKQALAQTLHTEPQAAKHLEYVRLHTGFCRKITVTPEEIQTWQQRRE